MGPWTAVCSELVALPAIPNRHPKTSLLPHHRNLSFHILSTNSHSTSTLGEAVLGDAVAFCHCSAPSYFLSVSLKHKQINDLFISFLFISLFPAGSQAQDPAHTCLVLSLGHMLANNPSQLSISISISKTDLHCYYSYSVQYLRLKSK